jgi:glyoxylase-like metal-dependent hydrolase (beta-lactamase superfamily II)
MEAFRMRFSIPLLAMTLATSVFAASPQKKTPAPGFYRLMIGDIEVTALADGTFQMPVDKVLTNTTPDKVNKALMQSFRSSPLPTSVNSFLINTGEKLVLIDAGTGTAFGPGTGAIVKNLRAAGYKPEEVDEIYITHLHLDHVAGLLQGDQMAFPNATVRADQHDLDYWLSADNAAKAPKDMKGFFDGAIAAFKPYQAAGRVKGFEGSTELVKGVKALENHGHTPGHTLYEVESQGKKLILLGDILHVEAVQFASPGTTIVYDADPKKASAQRNRVFKDLSKNGTMVGFAHVAFPGLGQIKAQGQGYHWVPLNYTVSAQEWP